MKKLIILGLILATAVLNGAITATVGTLYVGPPTSAPSGNTNDLRLYLKMDDANSQTTCIDSSGHGLDGTTTGTPTFSPAGGKVAGCLGDADELNGSSQYVTVTDTALLRPTTNITVCLWVYFNVFASGALVAHLSDSPYYGYQLVIDGGQKISANAGYDSNAASVVSPSVIPTGEWFHIAFTWNGTTGTIYTNGVLAAANGSMTGPMAYTATEDLTLGRSSFVAGSYITAQFDEVRIYNGCLTAAEILALPGF